MSVHFAKLYCFLILCQWHSPNRSLWIFCVARQSSYVDFFWVSKVVFLHTLRIFFCPLWCQMDCGTLLILLPLSFVVIIFFSLYAFCFSLLALLNFNFFFLLFITLQMSVISSRSISFQSDVGYWMVGVLLFFSCS